MPPASLPRFLVARLRRDLALFATAAGLALVIWFVITDSENVTVTEPLGFALPVQAVNIPSDLAVASRVPPVVIEIAGREDDVGRATPDDFVATVDLTGLPPGAHEIAVNIRSRDEDVTVRSVQPQSVVVILESVVSRQVPVAVEIENSPPLGFDVGEPVTAESLVTVSGIPQLVRLVDTVVARIDIRGATVTVDATVSLQARTSTGAAVGQVQISPPSIEVEVPVEQAVFRRAVAVTPRIHGEPAPGFRVRSISVEPVTAVVVGTLADLEAAGSATTEPVEISDRRSDLRASAVVVPPSGLTLEQPGLTVIVTVGLAPFTVEAVFPVPVEVTGLGGGLSVSLAPRRVAVRVRGPAPDIAELDASSFRVTVNAIGVQPGVHTEAVQVAFSGDLDIVSVAPREVTLVVERISGDAGSANGSSDGGAR
ncbi:MAG: hypothetical protein F4Y94_08805 [Chloroflexi bacterium]|nr:hypothetical protein [Chloroflexota bacterium]